VTQILVRRIARRARAPNFGGAIITEITRTINRDVKPDVLARFEDIVANWEHKPKFIATTKRTSDEIKLITRIAGKNAKIWQYVSRGTKPHPITARRGKTLAFMWGGPGSYQPKTYPGPSWGGPGTVRGGKMAYPVSVEHPGSEGRKFEEWIAKVEGPRFQGRISAAIRRGKNKARRQSGY
jgi:hypothetical protein